MLKDLLAFYTAHHKELQFVLTGILGMIFHYYKALWRNETAAPFKQWFGLADPHSTFMTFAAFIGAMFTALSTNALDSMNFYGIAVAGFTAGFSIDSAFNSVPDKKIV